MAHPQIAAFARLAKENEVPTRTLAGQKTLLARTMHDIRYDEVHDEILVANPFAQAILVFRGGADGDEAPLRIIQGPQTQMRVPDRLEVDPLNNEIIVPNYDSILVFPREAAGDVKPIRVIRGAETLLRSARSVAVDTLNNVIALAFYGQGGAGLQVFNRTDNGNVKPRTVIRGPKTEMLKLDQIQVYPPRGWILVTQITEASDPEPENPFVGIWSIHDSGDVPPRWKIGGPQSTLKKPRGVALNPKNKELIIADMRLNAVLTYSFPEIF